MNRSTLSQPAAAEHTIQDIEHINSTDEPIETHCAMLINIVEVEPAAPAAVGV